MAITRATSSEADDLSDTEPEDGGEGTPDEQMNSLKLSLVVSVEAEVAEHELFASQVVDVPPPPPLLALLLPLPLVDN